MIRELYALVDPVTIAGRIQISFDEIGELLSTYTLVVRDPRELEKVFKENSPSDTGLNEM
jgi:hypothetical protein